MAISPTKSIGRATNDGADHSGFLIKARELPVSSVGLPLPPLRRPLPAFEVKPFPQGPPPPSPKHRPRSLSTALDVLRLMDSLLIPISQDILDIAHNLFDAMLIRDTMSWTIMIVAHSETSDEEALKLFVQMLRRGLEATTLVFVHVLNACAHKSDFRIGEQAFEAYKEMRGAGTKKNHVMFSSILRACGQKGCDGRERGSDQKWGFESYPGVLNSLVSMYGRCGLLRDARRALEIAPTKQNTACWANYA
ncbi:hypothetical protein H6P81_004558 [Aristolochia fimbriata]|uniref:Pentatricopeptide repeat-containing protein n=1 Tax=Aristolochia fimbriata TaxID=158543 RepID=A0AAV7FFP4_ARIFI|nr:hypothetical protein H6P81_004558 [Aristolochia fimbriata]